MKCLIAFALIAAPATAAPLSQRIRELPPEEWVFQAVNVADAATTIRALNVPGAYEHNPLLGKHPSDAAVIGHKIGVGVLHVAGTMWLQDHAPRLVKPWEFLTIGVTGYAVVGNIRVRF